MMLKKICFFIFLSLFFHAGNLLAQIQEKARSSATNDCSNISVDYENNPNLTRQEKIELMDKALFHSLNKYESCQYVNPAASGRKKTAGSQAGKDSDSSGPGSSIASSSMSGMEPSTTQKSSTVSLHDKADKGAAAANNSADERAESMNALSNGKIPEDIPAVDNDSVLEGQIRRAAMAETDPKIREKLWNEYRKYRGLPVKKAGTATP